ncbi:targeting protein for Xklp2-like isoform X2 [Zingiber officinale]|uniref:targeting protein for Xklp2-like isoform X2 n=1 Tax=Zingiber officinale TaxID=94328 RepID=UPI001C4D3A7B|nr:targeting protein for Xklp2-like isoform X2 [Zingiber officinale]
MATSARRSQAPRRQEAGFRKLSENVDPNLLLSTPRRRPSSRSPATKPAKRIELTPKREAFVTPKKKSFLTPQKGLEPKRCPEEEERRGNVERRIGGEVEEKSSEGSSKANAMRRLILEEAMSSLPAHGAGRVMYLVKTFERLLSIHRESEGESGGGEEDTRKVKNWALPGMDFRPKAKASGFSPSPVSCSAECITGDCPEEGSSEDSRLSSGSNRSDEGKRNMPNSNGSSRRSWNKRLKVKTPLPFKLRTEQRGRYKEEQFFKKVKEMLMEEEKKRIHIAQGLPWTTEEPEIPVKPSIKEPTEPLDLILHSDVRAVDRAEFDLHIAERMSFLDQIKMERERLLKLQEEEEIRQLRKELVPKAQPMPYFDRPFAPKKSSKARTIPKEPRFQIHRLKEP